jgi:hypothetical protein
MAFGPEVMVPALLRAGDRCECRSEACRDHPYNDGRCQQAIHGGQFFAIKTNPDGPDTLDNCELVCADCFEHRAN